MVRVNPSPWAGCSTVMGGGVPKYAANPGQSRISGAVWRNLCDGTTSGWCGSTLPPGQGAQPLWGEASRNTPQTRDSLEFPAPFAGISVTVPGFAPRDTLPRLSCPQDG